MTTTAAERQPKRTRPAGFLIRMNADEREHLHTLARAHGVDASAYLRQLVVREAAALGIQPPATATRSRAQNGTGPRALKKRERLMAA